MLEFNDLLSIKEEYDSVWKLYHMSLNWKGSCMIVEVGLNAVILCGFCCFFYFAASIAGICHCIQLWLDAVKCYWLMHKVYALILKLWLYIGYFLSCVCFIRCWKSRSMITNFLSLLVTLAELGIRNYVWNAYDLYL